MLSLEGVYSLPELSRMITHYTGQSVTQLAGIRPGVWQAQLVSGMYVLKVRQHRSHLVDEQQVLESLGTFGVPVERLLHIWPVDTDRALCLYSHVGGEPLALDAALSRSAALGRQIGVLHRGLATMVGKTDVPVGKLPEAIIDSVVPALAHAGSPLLMVLNTKAGTTVGSSFRYGYVASGLRSLTDYVDRRVPSFYHGKSAVHLVKAQYLAKAA